MRYILLPIIEGDPYFTIDVSTEDMPEKAEHDESEGRTGRTTRRGIIGTLGLVSAAGVAHGNPAIPETPPGARNPGGGCRTRPDYDGSPRPGPALLYEPLPEAPPQLENTDGWEADPLMVSGTDAYVDGEYLYQDFIYDDAGANTGSGSLPPHAPMTSDATPVFVPPEGQEHAPIEEIPAGTGGGWVGNVRYPTDEAVYRHNAADLLEFRTRKVRDGIAYRVTLNTMTRGDVAGVAIGINRDPASSDGDTDWGYGIGELGNLGLDHVLVTWGDAAELDGEPVPSEVDVRRNQIEVTVPLDPGSETWRHYVAVGLFDPESKQFKEVQEMPTETHPGGSHGESPPPIFNVGFRFDEPSGGGLWRESHQADALADRDVSPFHADIDFGTLTRNETEYNVPTSGLLNRLYVSGWDFGQGIDAAENDTLNRIQPYTIVVPEEYQGDQAWPVHVHMHGQSGNHNQFAGITPNALQQFGEEMGAFYFDPCARGPNGMYHGEAALDVFEALRDAAAHYELDFERMTLGGYSMGGLGTFLLGSKYPDLFARGFSIAGPPDELYWSGPTRGHVETDQNAWRITENLRNLPLLMWKCINDEVINYAGVREYQEKIRDHGYRHELNGFPGSGHEMFADMDEWDRAREFLQGERREQTPPRVTYRRDLRMEYPEFGLVYDKSHWISDIEVTYGEESGLVDARSLAFGEAPPVPVDFDGSGDDPAFHMKHGTRWEDSDRDPDPENTLEVELEDVRSLTIWIEEANLDPTEPIELRTVSTHPATVTLASSRGDKEVEIPPHENVTTVQMC